jgi:hypothetical protein
VPALKDVLTVMVYADGEVTKHVDLELRLQAHKSVLARIGHRVNVILPGDWAKEVKVHVNGKTFFWRPRRHLWNPAGCMEIAVFDLKALKVKRGRRKRKKKRGKKQ